MNTATTPAILPDTGKITFRARIRRCRYGDGQAFHDWRVLMFHRGKLVGTTEKTFRAHTRHLDARNAARREIARLKKRRLFIIRVTARCISDGEERNCNTCAIAQALWHNQERMGYPKGDYHFRVSTYGAWMKCPGIVLNGEHKDEPVHIPVEALPRIVTGDYDEDMSEWTIQWDDWAESRHETLEEWRERSGEEDDARPKRPDPCSFVLDLDAFVPLGDDFD